MEDQESNTAQLERIEAIMEWRWGLEKESRKEENRDNIEGSKNGPRERQEEETPLSTFC